MEQASGSFMTDMQVLSLISLLLFYYFCGPILLSLRFLVY